MSTVTRMAVLTVDDVLFTAEVGPAAWIREGEGVAAFQLDGARMAMLKTNGHFLVREGPNTDAWSGLLASNVAAFDLDGTRIGTVTPAGRLYVKEGPVTAPWIGPLARVHPVGGVEAVVTHEDVPRDPGRAPVPCP